MELSLNFIILLTGYGFVDFEHQADAEKATQALQTAGIQAQMAKVSKVSLLHRSLSQDSAVVRYS